jgi:hypothetical protein
MDNHKPKPVHSLREFLSEIVVIVTGIVKAVALAKRTIHANAGAVSRVIGYAKAFGTAADAPALPTILRPGVDWVYGCSPNDPYAIRP